MTGFAERGDPIQKSVEPTSQQSTGWSRPRSANPVVIYADGACVGNPGPGAWCFIATHGDEEILRGVGDEPETTTNNRMELQAAIEGLNAIPNTSEIVLRSDSEYLLKGLQFWVVAWEENGWRTKKKRDVLNRDLWEQLVFLKACHRGMKIEWVKGHSGDRWNDLADTLAENQAARLKRSLIVDAYRVLGAA